MSNVINPSKEQWIRGLMADYPMIDRMMAESAVELYLEDPEYVDELAEGKAEIPVASERNTTYTYTGVTVEDPFENNLVIEQVECQ